MYTFFFYLSFRILLSQGFSLHIQLKREGKNARIKKNALLGEQEKNKIN